LDRACGGADRRVVGGDVAPAEEGLPFLPDDVAEDGLTLRGLTGVPGEEDEARAVVAGRGEGDAEPPTLPREEGVRHLEEDPRPVAGVGFAAAGPAVQEVLQDGERLAHDGVRRPTLDVDDEANATAVVLVPGIVEALRVGKAGGVRHRTSVLPALPTRARPASRGPCGLCGSLIATVRPAARLAATPSCPEGTPVASH